MNETWWVDPSQLDDDQKSVLSARPELDMLILGPPGSGKTNILMLRSNYVRSVAPRMVFLTFTRTLAEFLRAGPNVGREDQIKRDEIRTFMGWGLKLLKDHGAPLSDDGLDFDQKRNALIEAITELVETQQLGKLYDVVFIDEVQDFYEAELRLLRLLSDRVNAAGDSRQAIWQHKEGLPAIQKMVTEQICLKTHYRVGRNICEFADRVLPPKAGDPGMADGSNYNESARPSIVSTVKAPTEEALFDLCCDQLRNQVRYVTDEPIAVLAQYRDHINAFWEHIQQEDDLAPFAMIQRDGDYKPFGEDSLIRVMTVASAKGSEARTVHLLFAEDFGSDRRELAFTAVTRAKTEVTLYHINPLPGHMTPVADELPTLASIF
jgi:superfamily I DNA/RNA helicase